MFKVHDNVEVPARTVRSAGSAYDTLLEMEDGQCFDVPVEAEEGHTNRAGMPLEASQWQTSSAHARQSYIAGYAKRHGIKVITRWLPDGDEHSDGQAVVRVWHDGMVVDAEDELATASEFE